jgi:uncharacterized protein YaaN involved in tellurite resistance
MNECGVCKSKIKSLLYCNGCFQRAKSVAERRGRVEELKMELEYFKEKERSAKDGFYSEGYGNKKVIFQVLNNYYSEIKRIEKRLLELEKGELK